MIGKNYLGSFRVVLHWISLSKHDLLTCVEDPLTHCLGDSVLSCHFFLSAIAFRCLLREASSGKPLDSTFVMYCARLLSLINWYFLVDCSELVREMLSKLFIGHLLIIFLLEAVSCSDL